MGIGRYNLYVLLFFTHLYLQIELRIVVVSLPVSLKHYFSTRNVRITNMNIGQLQAALAKLPKDKLLYNSINIPTWHTASRGEIVLAGSPCPIQTVEHLQYKCHDYTENCCYQCHLHTCCHHGGVEVAGYLHLVERHHHANHRTEESQ